MNISDVFHIPGRGTVVTGLLEGNVPLNLGDALVCDGVSWQVIGIEQFKKTLTAAEPGANIGVLLKNGPRGDVLRGRLATFEPGAGASGVSGMSSVSGVAEPRPKKRRWLR